MSRPTRIDVAKLSGVAASTVSLILTDRGDELGISEETRQRVRKAALELGYYPNHNIRALRTGRSGNIGLYLRSDQWGEPIGYWAKLRAAIDFAVSEANVGLLVYCGSENISTEEIFKRQAGGAVDGVIILNSREDPITKRLIQTKMCAVEIGDKGSTLPFVAVDEGDGVLQIMRHLRERGYRRPCFLHNPSKYIWSKKIRVEAFTYACTQYFGQEPLMIEAPFGIPAFTAINMLDQKVDSVVCDSDEHAYHLLTTATRSGLRVPGDVAITGFDCLPTLGPSALMTSIDTHLDKLARLGVQKLVQIINNEKPELESILPVDLRIGDTT